MDATTFRACPTVAWAIAFLIVILGCNKSSEDQLPVFPVAGSATYNGQPMKGASIVLVPIEASPKLKMPPFGRIADDGTFEITSYGSGDGAPAGKYKVTFTWSDGDRDSPSDLFKGRFSDPKKPVAEVTVNEADNSLPPFTLKGPPVTPPAQ